MTHQSGLGEIVLRWLNSSDGSRREKVELLFGGTVSWMFPSELKDLERGERGGAPYEAYWPPPEAYEVGPRRGEGGAMRPSGLLCLAPPICGMIPATGAIIDFSSEVR
jgi:hypothetical protein